MTDAHEYVASIPAAAWPLRLPLIRHVRWMVNTYRVNRHYAMWAQMGQLPVRAHLDYAVCDAIWRGEK